MRCNKRVGGGTVTFACVVEVPVGATEHEGPCKAVEIARAVSARKRWEEGRSARETLAEFQTQPTPVSKEASAYQPTPVPKSTLQPDAYRQAHQPREGQFGAVGDKDCPHPDEARARLDDGTVVCAECEATIRASRTASLREFVDQNPGCLPPDPNQPGVGGPVQAEPWPSKEEAVQAMQAMQPVSQQAKTGTEESSPEPGEYDLFTLLTVHLAYRGSMAHKVEELYAALVPIAQAHPELIAMEAIDGVLGPLLSWLRGHLPS